MPERESERLQAVHRFLNLELDKDQELKEIVQLASDLCETPIGLLTLIGSDMQYNKIKIGTDTANNPRASSFCNHLIEQEDDIMIVPDALDDDRFSGNPSVTAQPNLRFYAGAPLTTHDGYTLGSLCVMDTAPKNLNDAQTNLLKALSKQIIRTLEFDRSLHIMKEQFLKVKDSEIKLKSFFESSGACHMLLGTDMAILAYNKNMADFLERMYPVRLNTGMKMNAVLQGAALEDFEADFNRASAGEFVAFERLMDYGRHQLWCSVSIEPSYNEQGELISVAYNTTDITERKRAEQKILAQNESLRQVAHMQSHDLRGPVASILGFMEIFKHSNYQACKEDLQMMEHAVRQLDSVIHTIVQLADNVSQE